LHLRPARARLPGAGQQSPRTAGVRRFPDSRASRAGTEAARVRRASQLADELPRRSGAPGADFAETDLVTATAPRAIHVAHSPDADDAFMFWAMAAGKIDTGGRHYVHELGDIESLNRRALAGELEVTAVSLHAYAYLADRYALLAHGASIGDRYGPRLVSVAPRPAEPRTALAAPGRIVAVPGELTTAFLALKLYQPAVRHVVVPFDEIEDYVLAGRADAGLLIHEGQLTYGDRGLHLWVDLGEWWHGET